MNPYAKTRGEFARSCGFDSYKQWIEYFCKHHNYNNIGEFKEEILFEIFNDGLIAEETLRRNLRKLKKKHG